MGCGSGCEKLDVGDISHISRPISRLTSHLRNALPSAMILGIYARRGGEGNILIMKIISLINTQQNIRKKYQGIPPEDFAYKSGKTFAVCDGVTLLHQHPYPNPSPAATVARIAAKTIVRSLAPRNFKGIRSLRHAFIEANVAIKRYNRRIGLTPRTVDFLTKQYAATVCAFGRIINGKLYWGQLNDCGVMIIDAKGEIIMDKLLDRGPVDAYVQQLRNTKGFSAGSPQEHQYFRREVVNNARLFHKGKRIRWGVMTGEPQAIKFLQTGSKQLRPGWIVIFYSDGMIPLFASHAFRQLIASNASKRRIDEFMKNKEHTGRRFKSERTMIVVGLDSLIQQRRLSEDSGGQAKK